MKTKESILKDISELDTSDIIMLVTRVCGDILQHRPGYIRISDDDNECSIDIGEELIGKHKEHHSDYFYLPSPIWKMCINMMFNSETLGRLNKEGLGNKTSKYVVYDDSMLKRLGYVESNE